MTRTPPAISNAAIADALHEMALFLEMQDVPFKPRAYEKAAQAVAAYPRSIAELYAEGGAAAIDDIPAVGKGIAGRIAGMLDSGALADLEQLRSETPIDVTALTAVAGVGPKRVEHAAVAGSIRRRRETVGDVDVLVAAKPRAGERAAAAFTELPEVADTIARGPSKISVRLRDGLHADLRVVAPASYGAALVYFTGSKAHNVALRKLALSRGWKLNEYGLFADERMIAGRTEAEVYAKLGLAWIPPELREDQGEIAAAAAHALPRLVEPKHIRGDLHIHTNWTDGRRSIAEMAEAAQARGLAYLAITDHARSPTLASGLDPDRLRAQLDEVRRVDAATPQIRVLSGVEVDIAADGSLNLPDDLLAELDVVGAAIHDRFDLPRAEMTRRLLAAIEHPSVTMIYHLTARALGRRPPIDFDVDAVLEACARTHTILEIDSQPDRLDLPDVLVRRAIAAGVRLAINSDAHAPEELDWVGRYGVGVARRGWAEPGNVVNCQSLGQLLAELQR